MMAATAAAARDATRLEPLVCFFVYILLHANLGRNAHRNQMMAW